MNRKWNLALSLAAGLLGGLCSHYLVARPVFAQAQEVTPPNISAHSFTLLNDKGVPSGFFNFDGNGNAIVKLLGPSGRVIWSTQPLGVMHQLAVNDSK